MGGTIALGRVAGVAVRAHWSSLVGLALLVQVAGRSVLPAAAPGHSAVTYWLAGGVTAAVLLVSLLAHELAHSLVARRAGVRVRGITLWLLGGVSEFVEQPPTPKVEIRISLSGPVTSLVLGGLFGLAGQLVIGADAASLLGAALGWLAAMNLLIGVFNLLPGQPLDGGRVLHGLVWRYSGDRDRATLVAARCGQVLGFALGGVGILLALRGRLDGFWLLLLGWFLIGAATSEAMSAGLEGELEGVSVRELMSTPADVAPGWWTVQAFVERTLREADGRHRDYPVVDFDGRFLGVVSLADLARCPVASRASTALRQLVRPLPVERRLSPDTPVRQVVPLLGRGRELAVVLDDDRVVGVLTPTDLGFALSFAAELGQQSRH